MTFDAEVSKAECTIAPKAAAVSMTDADGGVRGDLFFSLHLPSSPSRALSRRTRPRARGPCCAVGCCRLRYFFFYSAFFLRWRCAFYIWDVGGCRGALTGARRARPSRVRRVAPPLVRQLRPPRNSTTGRPPLIFFAAGEEEKAESVGGVLQVPRVSGATSRQRRKKAGDGRPPVRKPSSS